MNVLYTNFHTNYGGGHTTYIKYLLKNIKNTNFLACPATSQLYQMMEKEGGIQLFDVFFPSKFNKMSQIIKSIFKMVKIIDEYNIDIVHTNENADNRIIFYASFFTRKKFKVVLTKHNDKPIKKRITSQLRFNKFNDAVIYVSNSVVNTIGVKWVQVPTYIIENGIDTDYWQLAPTVPNHTLTLVSIAGTAPCKGWQYLIQAIKRLSLDEKQRFKVKIVGDIPNEKRIVDCLGTNYCSQQVSFVGYREEPKSELIGADIGFVLSDSGETISFASREMMSCGLPVIVSDIGSLPENVHDGIDGWVTQRSNVDSIHQTLLNILKKTPAELFAMKRAARQKALDEFSVRTMLEKTLLVYDSL